MNLYESFRGNLLRESYSYNWKDDIKEVEATDENLDIWYAVAENMCETSPKDYGDDPQEVMSNIISIWKISKGSRLYKYLLKWYKTEAKLLKKVRDVYDTRDAIYFVTGTGYSIFDADLLGGNADGTTARRFDDFVAKEEEANPEVSDDEESVRLVYNGKVYYEFDRDEWNALDYDEQENYMLDAADQASEEEGYPVDQDEIDVEED